MTNLIKTAPFALEITTKIISFITSLLLIYSLTTSEFGEFSYARSFVLIVATLLLFGLQASTFKFANYTSKLRIEYLTFSLIFIIFVGVLFSVFISVYGYQFFSKFDSPLFYWLQYLILPSMIVFFFVAYYKAIGLAVVGYSLTLLNAISIFSLILILETGNSVNIETALDVLLFSIFLTSAVALLTASKSIFSLKYSHHIWPIKEWCSVSVAMWLSGFLPLFLLQGLMLFFGFFFNSVQLGVVSIAVLIATNLATFKEVSISIYLPRLIGNFKKTQSINNSQLLKCILVGASPIVCFIALCFTLEQSIIEYMSPKITVEFFNYLYLLAFCQLIMSIYQPIWRIISSIGFHSSVLRVSLLLTVLLIALYSWFGYTQKPLLMIGSSVLISFLALIFGVLLVKRNVK